MGIINRWHRTIKEKLVVYDVFDLSKADFDYFDLLKVYPPVRKNEKK